MARKSRKTGGGLCPPTGIYADNGYFNPEAVDVLNCTFNIILGGRGTGKTYGLLSKYVQEHSTIIYLRRSDIQRQISSSEQFTPYKTILESLGFEYTIPKDKIKSIYTEDFKIASFLSLSTFSNIRGFDTSEYSAIVYDEFIPERTDSRIRNEYESLLNLYETVNRNRELQGKSPVKMWMLANSNTINSPILYGLGLINKILEMQDKNQFTYIDKDRSLSLTMLHNSPVSNKKQNTALYKLSGTGAFNDMSIGNIFSDKSVVVKKEDIRAYRPLVKVGELYIYEHKSKGVFYVTFKLSGTFNFSYSIDTHGLNNFRKKYGFIYEDYLLGYVLFESQEIEYLFNEYLKKL